MLHIQCNVFSHKSDSTITMYVCLSIGKTPHPFRINFSTSPPPSSFNLHFATFKLLSLFNRYSHFWDIKCLHIVKSLIPIILWSENFLLSGIVCMGYTLFILSSSILQFLLTTLSFNLYVCVDKVMLCRNIGIYCVEQL